MARRRARLLDSNAGRKKRKPPPKTTKDRKLAPAVIAQEARRNHVSRLLEHGVVRLRAIKAELEKIGMGVSLNAVSVDVAAVREEWREDRVADFEAARDYAREATLATLRAAWEGWLASREDVVTTRRLARRGAARGKGGAPESSAVVEDRRSSAGNPEFLTRAQRAIEGLRRIDGIDKPIKLNLDADGGLAELAGILGVEASDLKPGA